MKQTLNTDEINNLVADTMEKMESIKGTNSAPYIHMDLSSYTSDTLEAIKESFVRSGIRFDDRWNNGSDFVVKIDVKSAPPIFRSGRRDAFTRSGGGIFSNSGHEKKSSLFDQIQSASARATNLQSAAKAPEKGFDPERS